MHMQSFLTVPVTENCRHPSFWPTFKASLNSSASGVETDLSLDLGTNYINSELLLFIDITSTKLQLHYTWLCTFIEYQK